MRNRSFVLGLMIGAAAGVVACGESNQEGADMRAALKAKAPAAVGAIAQVTDEPAKKEFNPRLLRRFKPLRKVLAEGAPPSSEQVALGRALYFDKRLSKNGSQSCNSCHALASYGVDGEATSPGAEGARGGRNSPTVYNAAGSFVQFWDGRAPDVEAQALGPILNPIEMGMTSAEQVEGVLAKISGYPEAFKAAFPQDKRPLSYENVGRAIGAFERGLTTPARWDQYLEGDKSALTAAEVEGLRVFTNVGCMVCHTGEMLGGSMYEKVGAVEPWPNQKDHGRFAVSKLAGDKMMFKVPTLRNIEKTAPYFHDGSAPTLEAAVTMMGRHQLGLELEKSEIDSIVTWLKSLTGTLPSAYIEEPVLPGMKP